ncbi:unnamed protein product [Amoebophrya sp. A25]|nr:unnamed protein product [Amoebophrya sp. A25]|eukprot:GSA25T00005819001.1
MVPYLGPILGNTRVVVEAQHIPTGADNMIRCIFGTVRTKGVRIDSKHFMCVTPAQQDASDVTVKITFNLQEFAEASQAFVYYEEPVIDRITPPLGPSGQSVFLKIEGRNFINTDYLKVRFGGVTKPLAITAEEAFPVRKAFWVSSTEIHVETPVLTFAAGQEDYTRLPVYVSNNAQSYSPDGVDNWDEETTRYDTILKHFVFHPDLILKQIRPSEGMHYGGAEEGGFVSVVGQHFVNTSYVFPDHDTRLLRCSFEWVESKAIFISTTQILCEVPNMLAARSYASVGFARVRVTLNGNDYSRSVLPFKFLGVCPAGSYCRHKDSLNYGYRVVPCPVGHNCEHVGNAEPMPCRPGQYQSYEGSHQCRECPKGFYCPNGRQVTPLRCPNGWMCDEIGLMMPYRRCPRGHICLGGVATADHHLIYGTGEIVVQTSLKMNVPNIMYDPEVVPQKPQLCAAGLHCYEGTSALQPAVSGAGNYSTPQPCYQGFFCPSGSGTPHGDAGACPLGKYCPTPRHSGVTSDTISRPNLRADDCPAPTSRRSARRELLIRTRDKAIARFALRAEFAQVLECGSQCCVRVDRFAISGA